MCSKLKREQKVQITKVVLVGSGSFHDVPLDCYNPEEHDLRMVSYWCNRAKFQLAAALKISEVLGEPGHALPLFAQEFRYSSMEKEYLRNKLHVTVIDHPDVLTVIDKHTMLIFFCVGPEFAYDISKGPLPGAMITSHPTLDGALDRNEVFSDMVSPAVEMFRHYNKREICPYLDGVPGNKSPLQNQAFDQRQCFWVQKDASEKLRPTGLIHPIVYRIIRKAENGIEYEQVQLRVIKELDKYYITSIVQDEQAHTDPDPKDGNTDDEPNNRPTQVS